MTGIVTLSRPDDRGKEQGKTVSKMDFLADIPHTNISIKAFQNTARMKTLIQLAVEKNPQVGSCRLIGG